MVPPIMVAIMVRPITQAPASVSASAVAVGVVTAAAGVAVTAAGMAAGITTKF
jgi:hypothetical protein